LNSKFTQKAWLAGRFVDFLLHSGNRYRLHSPFLYSLAGEVIRGDKLADGVEEIEMIRQELKKSKEIINKTDYGEGGKNNHSITYPAALQHIVMTSLTSPRHARRLYRLARFTKAGRIIEIGTSLGITTAYLALANPDARIITLEGCPELSHKARELFNRLGLKNIELMEGRFEDTLSSALNQLGSIDLVYIDGNHRKEAMLDYYEKCLAHSGNETVMVFDDIRASAGMEQAWEQVRKKPEVTISLDLFFTGWIFLRKESSKQHFRLRYI
jgi:predicted O-methyltransferase YrrM